MMLVKILKPLLRGAVKRHETTIVLTILREILKENNEADPDHTLRVLCETACEVPRKVRKAKATAAKDSDEPTVELA